MLGLIYFISVFSFMIDAPSFKESQLQHDRVKTAFTEKEQTVKTMLQSKGIETSGYQIFLRAFKKERELEVWVKPKDEQQYRLLSIYAFCTSSGNLGPKRKEGDLQIPEGVYQINHFNPYSTFHLSIGINYPNASDKILSDKKQPGSSIYIHGDCVSIGCIPITDDKIKEVYVLAVEAKHEGQKTIPVHIFPSRLEKGVIDVLAVDEFAAHKSFWANLQKVYEDFQISKKLKPVSVNSKGEYQI